MIAKEQIREYLKSVLKFAKLNPEIFTGFLFGFILILVLAGMMFSQGSRKFEEINDNEVLNDKIEVVTQLPEDPALVTLPVIYQVQTGDSSWKIAQNFYGCGEKYLEIEKANNLESNTYLEIGQKLVIPELEQVCGQVAEAKIKIPDPTTSAGRQVRDDSIIVGEENNKYEVVPGDCLWSIALEQTGNPYNWVAIYQANKNVIGNNPDLIYPQTNLIIPNSLY